MFFSFENLIYPITEHFEFAARLCEAEIYRGMLGITIELHDIERFVLATDDPNRVFTGVFWASSAVLAKTWTIQSADLVAHGGERSLQAIVWFLQRFGWEDPPLRLLEDIQNRFLASRS